jgi:hypothetical protein
MAQDKLREESHDFNEVRPFTEPALSEILQPLRSLGMTASEGFRVTTSRSFSTAWEVLKWNHRILYLGIFQSAI